MGGWVAGIDEAGRGPVLGPLVVAGVATQDAARLVAMGCRDSKKLSAAKRERIARLLHADPDVFVELRVIDAATIDQEMASHTLNDIELQRFQEVATALRAPRVIADAADVDAERFAARLAEGLPPGIHVVAEHQADDHHAVVAAASIIAKVARDQAVAEMAAHLERRLPVAMGSGYPGDAQTRRFLAAWVATFGDVPPGARRSWATSKALLAPRPGKLDDFHQSQ